MQQSSVPSNWLVGFEVSKQLRECIMLLTQCVTIIFVVTKKQTAFSLFIFLGMTSLATSRTVTVGHIQERQSGGLHKLDVQAIARRKVCPRTEEQQSLSGSSLSHAPSPWCMRETS